MGRLARILLLALLTTTWPQVHANAQTDPVAEVLTALERALGTGEIATFVARIAPSLPPDTRDRLAELSSPGTVSAAVVRERSRSESAVLADIFVRHGRRGTVASWLLEFGPGRAELRAITEVARFTDLFNLALDESRQLTVTNLVVSGPDFTLTLPSGLAFVADVDGAATALVLLGRAQVRFSPPDEAERGQLRVFAGTSDFQAVTNEAFIRLNPSDIDRFITGQIAPARAVNAAELDRAREIFDSRSALGQQLDLGDLMPGRWTVSPGRDSLTVDFRTSRDEWLTYGRSPQAHEDVALVDRERHRQISLYRSAAVTTGSGSLEWSDDPFDIEHADLDLVFDPMRLWLGGRASLRLSVRQQTSSLSLGLGRTLVVTSVSSPELGRLMPLRPAGQDQVLVGLPRALEPGEIVTIDVQYHGMVRPQNLTDDLIRLDGIPPQDPLLDFPFPVEPRYLYSAGTWWYPRPASAQHAPAAIRVTVPADFHVVATGQLVSTTESEPAPELWPRLPDSVRSFQYRAGRPVRYLALLVSRLDPIGRTSAATSSSSTPVPSPRDNNRVDVEVFVSRGQSGRVRATPERVASVVSFYSALLGGAPYPSLTVAALEDTLPGGHSPAYFSLLNQAHVAAPMLWSRDPVAFNDAPDFFMAHEVAHQWFGQAVAGRDYHGRWISEGFAQYLAWLYVASVDGADAGQRLMARMRDTVAETPPEGPIHLGSRLGHLRNDRRIFRTIVYNKSAVVLHMLRRLVGDDSFFAGLRRVYTAHRFTGIDVDQIRDAFQTETPLPLDRFFTRWVKEAGQPRLRFSWSQPSRDLLAVRIEQIGDVFDLPYDVVVQDTAGTNTRVTLRLSRQDETFTLPVPGVVRRVLFDDPLTIATIAR